jgi:tRNA G18 (ribose-2'-O)-methylase SpoU
VKIVILENIRSAYNVGSIFRTADGSGVKKLYLAGYTPTPVDRFGRTQNEIKKTSLGASETLEWEQVPDIQSCIQKLKTDGYTVVAVEQTPTSISLQDFLPPQQVAYIFGNEVEGVSDESCALADTIVEIPMLGQKESLNVSVAVGITLYHGLV